MSKIVFVINPASGVRKNSNFPAQAQEFCNKHSITARFIYTSGEQDREAIETAIAEDAPDIVAACGGDGTVNLIANILQNKSIKLAIIPMGSSNGLAYNLNIPTNPLQALDLISTGSAQQVELILINKKHLCLHLSDIGFNALLIKHSEESDQRGKLKYIKNIFRTIVKNEAFKVDIVSDTLHKKMKAEMVVLANAQKYSTGAFINPLGRFGDGKFEICVVKPYKWWQFFPLSINLLRGTAQTTDMLTIYSVKRVKLMLNKPRLLQVDGELIGKFTEIEAEVLPKAITIIAGQRGKK